jgi:hypothetical protein
MKTPARSSATTLENLRNNMKNSFYSLGLFFALALITGCATAQRGAMNRAYSGIENKEYEFSLKRLSEAESYVEPEPELKAQISYLKGICYEGLYKNLEAKGIYKFIINTFPNSQYSYMARERLNSIETNDLLEKDLFSNRKQGLEKNKPKE